MSDPKSAKPSNAFDDISIEISPELADELKSLGEASIGVNPAFGQYLEALGEVAVGRSELAVGINPELEQTLAAVGDFPGPSTVQVSLERMALAGVDAAVITELASLSATVPFGREVIAGIDAASAAANALQVGVAQAFSDVDLNSIAARTQESKAHFRIIDAAIEDELSNVPFTVPREGPFELLLNFSTHPKGLGLSAEEFLDVFNRGEWPKFYQSWKEARLSALLAKKKKGKPGRPPKDKTSDIRRAWIESGQTDITSAVLGRIARIVFPDEWEKATTESERRKLRERVRTAIKRGEGNPAT